MKLHEEFKLYENMWDAQVTTLIEGSITEEFDRVRAAAQCMRNCYDFYEAIASKKPQAEINKYGKKAYKFVKDRFGLVDDKAEDLLWSGYVLWKRFRENNKTESLTEAKTDPFHEAIFEAVDYLTEFNDIFPVPESIGADSWGELRDDINYGLSSDFEIAEIIMEYLDKDLAISRKHPEMFEDDPQSELTLETYNRLKRAYDRAVAAYEAEHPEDFEESVKTTALPSNGYRVVLADYDTDDFDINVEFGMQDPDENEVVDYEYLLKPGQTRGDLVVYLSYNCGFTSIYVHDERPATTTDIKRLSSETFPVTDTGDEYKYYGDID